MSENAEVLAARLLRTDEMLQTVIADRDRKTTELNEALLAKQELEADRNDLATKFGAEVSRSQEWMKKAELAQKRADEAEQKLATATKTAGDGLRALRRADLESIRDGMPRPLTVEQQRIVDFCITALEVG